MADGENLDRDLFGEPAGTPERGQGRPPHLRTRETANRVALGFARGWDKKEVARSIGITVPTLDKHYFDLVQRAKDLATMIESVQLGRLNDQAEKGNVAAEKELMKALEKGRSKSRSEQMVDRQSKADRPKPVGKKEAAKAAAAAVSGKFAPPPQPSLLKPAGRA